MKYRALAIDLDGTLLVGEDIPEANVHAVRAARDAGLQVIIATARWRHVAQRIAAEIGISGPIIACSGAQVFDPAGDVDVFDERLPADFAAELYQICDSNRCIATVTFSDQVLLKLDGEPDPALLSEEMHWVKALTGADSSLPRVAAIQGSAVNALIKNDLAPRHRGTVNIFDSIGPNGKIIVMITGVKASKGTALARACTHLNLDPETVVAFGDAENDVEMFKLAGASVAMGQAQDEVKAQATAVTAPNTEAGVARAIEKLLATGALE